MSVLKRIVHTIFWHKHSTATLIDKFTSESHYGSGDRFVYTINLMQCECGFSYIDQGVESRSLDEQRKRVEKRIKGYQLDRCARK